MRWSSKAGIMGCALAFVSCGSFVRKSEVTAVKRVAILSLFGNNSIYHGGNAEFSDDWGSSRKESAAGIAFDSFKKELKKLGWKVMDAHRAVDSPEYQNIKAPRRILASSTRGTSSAFFAMKGMRPFVFDKVDSLPNAQETDTSDASEVLKHLGRMATLLGVDAVAIVEIRYCYQTAKGEEVAYVTADSALKLVDRKGVLIVNMPAIKHCGSGSARAQQGAEMLGGKLMLTNLPRETFEKIFRQVSAATAERTVIRIQKEIQ